MSCVMNLFLISADYFKELEKAKLLVDNNKLHKDEGLLYTTTRVVVRRGLNVDIRALLVTAGKQKIEDKTPIHIADLQSMTEDYVRRGLAVMTITQVV